MIRYYYTRGREYTYSIDDDNKKLRMFYGGTLDLYWSLTDNDLDITDDIGFDPTEIIEKDELGENKFSENIEEDSESSDDEGFNAMPALAGALAGGLAGAGAGMLLDDEDDEDDEEEK